MIELWNNQRRVAQAKKIDLGTKLKAPDLYHGELGLFYFSNITLAPIVAFEHIAGAALNGFLDRCSLHCDEINIYDLRYVHGHSEVMKGRPLITSVLLARQDPDSATHIKESELAELLPEIWHRFQHIRAEKGI